MAQPLPDLAAVRAAEGDAVDALPGGLVQQLEAARRVPVGIAQHLHGDVVVSALLQEVIYAVGHGVLDVGTPLRLDHREAPGRAAGGQGAGHAVGTVVQLRHHRQDPLPHLGFDIGAVMEHPVHRADGYPRPLRNHLDGGPHENTLS